MNDDNRSNDGDIEDEDDCNDDGLVSSKCTKDSNTQKLFFLIVVFLLYSPSTRACRRDR